MKHKVYLEYETKKNGADVVIGLCLEHTRFWAKKKSGKFVIRRS